MTRLKITTKVLMLIGLIPFASCSFLVDFEECTVNADCAENLGNQAVCSDGVCDSGVTIENDNCTLVGDVGKPGSLSIGVMLPLTGEEAGFGIPLNNAIRIAYEDFESIEGIGGEPITMVVCDTKGTDKGADEVGDHLVNTVKVSAIIGPDFSSQTLSLAEDYAIDNDVVVVTPSGTATTISNLDDKNLVWRTTASDVGQSEALSKLLERTIEDRGLTPESAIVWMMNIEGDAYSEGLRDAMVQNLSPAITGSSTFVPLSYPTNWQDGWFVDNIPGNATPDIVAILGVAESWDIAEQIDDQYGDGAVYLFADGAKNEVEAGKSNAALEGRIFGTAPQNVGDVTYTPYTNFRIKYQAKFDEDPDDLQFVAHAFDAFYIIALAAAAEGFSGPEIAKGLARLSAKSGDEFSPISTDATRAISVLRGGDDINFQGSSGLLDFDENGDPTANAISLWCFEKGNVPEKGQLLTIEGELTELRCVETAEQ